MRNLLLGLLAIVLIGTALSVLYPQVQQKINHSNPPASTLPAATPDNQPLVVVGGDSDEHGCKGSAGYSWCQVKQKCLRVWEENCGTNEDTVMILQSSAKKNNWSDADTSRLIVRIATNDGRYASGSIDVKDGGGGGFFYAVKVNGLWQVIADGNGIVKCSNLIDYPDYPKSLIPQCFDQNTDKIINR